MASYSVCKVSEKYQVRNFGLPGVSSAWMASYYVYRVSEKYPVRNFGLPGSA